MSFDLNPSPVSVPHVTPPFVTHTHPRQHPFPLLPSSLPLWAGRWCWRKLLPHKLEAPHRGLRAQPSRPHCPTPQRVPTQPALQTGSRSEWFPKASPWLQPPALRHAPHRSGDAVSLVWEADPATCLPPASGGSLVLYHISTSPAVFSFLPVNNQTYSNLSQLD